MSQRPTPRQGGHFDASSSRWVPVWRPCPRGFVLLCFCSLRCCGKKHALVKLLPHALAAVSAAESVHVPLSKAWYLLFRPLNSYHLRTFGWEACYSTEERPSRQCAYGICKWKWATHESARSCAAHTCALTTAEEPFRDLLPGCSFLADEIPRLWLHRAVLAACSTSRLGMLTGKRPLVGRCQEPFQGPKCKASVALPHFL